MELVLSSKNDELLTNQEKKEIGDEIDTIIAKHKYNRCEINKLVFDSVNSLTTSEARNNELKDQNPLKRIWGNFTGKNNKIHSEVDKNLIKAQYSAQQTIQKLAEQNLMSFELITAVNNKLNTCVIEIENEINNIYSILIKFFKQTRSNIIQLENRMDKIEKNLNLLNWTSSIEYQMIEGIEYSELEDMEKILRLAVDFYNITKGEWTVSELLLLKSAISDIGLSPKGNIRYVNFIKYICEHDKLYEMLLNTTSNALINENRYNMITEALVEYKLLEGEQNYLITTISDIVNKEELKNEDDLKYLIIRKHQQQKYLVDINKEINIFDFILELLLNIETINNNSKINIVNNIEEDLDFNQMEIGDLKKCVEASISDAQCELAARYYDGKNGVEKDLQEAYRLYTLSGQQGNPKAQNKLGHMYRLGEGTERNYNKAFEFYKLSAEQGDVDGQANLGVCYEQGVGTQKNDEEAVRWYKIAADNGDQGAQVNLGFMYRNGNGVNIDYNEAIKWYQKSANQGNSRAQNLLGDMYYEGKGTAVDYKKAMNLYIESAEKGNNCAQFSLGYMYEFGKGVGINYYEAAKWHKLSFDQGNKDAEVALPRTLNRIRLMNK